MAPKVLADLVSEAGIQGFSLLKAGGQECTPSKKWLIAAGPLGQDGG